MTRSGRGALVVVAVLLARPAGAGDVELAPFAGIQFPGSVASSVGGRPVSIGIGLDYGGTLDIGVAPGWRAELLYSRQATELGPRDGGRFGLKLERYLIGIEEEKGEPPLRFFGVFLAGVTRFAPGLNGYDSDVRFTLGLSLGSSAPSPSGLGSARKGAASSSTWTAGAESSAAAPASSSFAPRACGKAT